MNKLKFLIVLIIVMSVLLSCKKIKFDYSSDVKPNISVYGNGSITIVLESGMGNWSLFYKNLIPMLSQNYKVITVDRAGYNNTNVPSGNRDALTLAKELNSMLIEKNLISDTMLLVGHSFGGCVAREYQNLFPSNVKGMILIDASHSEQFSRLPLQFNDLKNEQIKGMQKTIKTAQRGFLKTKQGKKKIPTFNLPSDLLEDYYLITTNPQYYATFHGEVKSFDESLTHLKSLPNLSSLPLLVLSSEHSMDATTISSNEDYPFAEHNQKWLQLQSELTLLSTNSTYASTNLSNHYIALFQPQWVTDKIDIFINNKIR